MSTMCPLAPQLLPRSERTLNVMSLLPLLAAGAAALSCTSAPAEITHRHLSCITAVDGSP
jgi:hypothetical protein